MNVHFVIAHSLQTRLPQRRLSQSRIKLGKGLGKGEFLVVYETLTTRLMSGGCVEEGSIGQGQYGKKSDERRGLRKLADATGGRIERI